GGHYDRAFAIPHRPGWLVGIGYAFQQVARVPQDPWDLRLDAVVTERATVTCRIGGATPLLRKEDRDDHGQHHLDTGQPGAGGRTGLPAGRRTAPAV
ncbi:MAG: 5-formyltetrahydrofolate cyclo-ligase, partial [Thermoanaerobaculia bacterium]